MKITKIDVIKPRFGNFIKATGCRIYTDEGIYGDGEASLNTGTGAEAGFAQIVDYAPLLIGMDPLCTEMIWDRPYRTQRTFWGENGGPITYGGMSALDMALWDIKGKYFNTPIYNLLGGKKRDKLRAYASQPQFGWRDDFRLAQTPGDLAANCKRAVEDGYDAVKVDFLWGTPEFDLLGLRPAAFWDGIEEKVAAVREAIGPQVDLIVENHGSTDALSVVQMCNRIEKYNIFYIEEVTVPDPKLTKFVRDQIHIPIASGERLQNRWQYRPYFENLSLQIIQPDLGTCGGITETKKVCDMAAVYEVGVQCHNCHSPISVAAALHMEAAISNFVIHEDTGRPFYVFPDTGENMCTEFFVAKDGYMSVPEGPGLGVEWAERTMSESCKVTVTESDKRDTI